MKKPLTIILLLVLILLLAACGGNSGDNNTSPANMPDGGNSVAAPEASADEAPEAAPSLTSAQLGDVIKFGNYEWRVLALKGGKALIISEKLLEEEKYNEEGYNRWQYSAIRTYLNGAFYSDAFDDSERAKICETNVVNDDNQWNETVSGGADTRDKIFLLSLEEVVEYFGDSGEFANKPENPDIDGFDDQYNEARTAYTSRGEARGWWLRSPGDRPSYAAIIGYDGFVDVNGTYVKGSYGVRPALWLKLDGPALETDHDPIIEHPPVTYVTNNKVFAIDIPYSLEMTPVPSSGSGDYFKIESFSPKWSFHFYEQTTDGGFTFDRNKNVVVNDIGYEITPIVIAGKEGYYFRHEEHADEMFLDIQFPNPTSDNKNAIYGSIWIFIDLIEGYEIADYLKIPEIEAILNSIRVPE